ncbi:D-threonate kinase [Paenibacillus solanacearum]|uniref:D-threonate kinase n=1 Tax=Paenibacillus solanacearum TaxID=2048548 RepID=A0A916NR58_9BACL|nr:four-carbon acid sugar kinase family protein [Paenibacillus solanacearum]CAG7636941.1 D-threonate kinase [Paenibacillus solanacearum]
MKRLAIIADDLTGASDSGVQLAGKGLHTQVIFDWQGLSSDAGALQSIVIDTDSRAVPGEEAYRRVRSATEALKDTGFDFIYKKMDSTLRGNVGQEIDAVMDAYNFKTAMVVPAFPRIGRTTVKGIHYLNGVPIHETEIARDPKTPVPESDVCKLLASQSRLQAGHLSLAAVRSGAANLIREVEASIAQDLQLLVFDAETDDDMRRIAELVPLLSNRVLWAGSAGLAEHLPVERQAAAPPAKTDRDDRPVMLVAGSISKVTREQVGYVNAQSDVVDIELDPIALLTSPERQRLEKERCLSAISAALERGAGVSFHAGSSPEQVASAKELGASIGLDSSGVSNRIADALGAVAASIAAKHPLQGLVLTGGDTAKAVCRHMGVHGVELIRELEPGIPLGKLLGAGNLMVVTKAGAFGGQSSLWHAMQSLKGENDDE